MARFIHLTDERLARRIEKTGIEPAAVGRAQTKYVFATPAPCSCDYCLLRGEIKSRTIREAYKLK